MSAASLSNPTQGTVDSPPLSAPLPTDENATAATTAQTETPLPVDGPMQPQELAEREGVVLSNALARDVQPAPPPPPSRSASSRQCGTFAIPVQLVKPGMEMLKVSAKSARRVKPRRVWLELASDTPDDGELGLEVGVGVVGGQDVRLCWEKNGPGLGFSRTTNYASVPLSRIRDLRFTSAGSPYRTSLHLPPSVEPRWMTVIYAVPPSSSFLSSVAGGPAYKLVHFIAHAPQDLDLVQKTLEGFKEGRLARGISGGGAAQDPLPEETDKVVHEVEVHQLCARLGMGMSKAEISAAFRRSAAPNDFLDFRAFQTFVKLLKRRADVEEIYRTAVEAGEPGFDEAAWATFLRDVQGVTDDFILNKTFAKYALPSEHFVALDGFVSFLMSSDNAAIKDESKQDMTRPLSEYFISSSHNTYLIGSQFQGESTVEGYIRALQQGCRSVELDVWDGDNGEPAVTHGRTLTTKIPVRNVLQAIAQYAFLASPYPVILSVEVHCELDQQDKLAAILHETLGDRLVNKRIDEMEADKELEKLPSPQDLRGMFLLKAKNKFMSSNENGFSMMLVPSGDSSSSEPSSHSSSDSDFKNSKFYRAIRQLRGSESSSSRPPILRAGSSRSSVSSATSPVPVNASLGLPPTSITGSELSISPPAMSAMSPAPLPVKAKDMAMSNALANLLVYTVGVKARGFNKKEKYALTHVISLGESRLSKMLRDEATRQDFVAHNRAHLTRAYPKGSRLTSSNFAPHHMWAAGVQLVALNWQTWDVGMELNSAMFARASRCGYVLKPEFLRKKGLEKDKVASLRSEKYRLELEIISAQQLPRPRGSGGDADACALDPFVEVSLFVPGVISAQKRRTPVVLDNAFNPTFRSASSTAVSSASQFSFTFSSHPSPGMLDLVFVRFEVLNAKGNIKAAQEEGKGESVGAYTIGVGALMPGYRHLPLYDSMGDQHLYSTLFIKSLGKPEVLPVAAEPTAAASSPPSRPATTSRNRLAALLLLLPLAFWLSFPRHDLNHLSWLAPAAGDRPVARQGASCPVQVEPKNVGPDWRPEQDDEYRKLAVQRLQGAVRIRTESYDDMAGPEDPRFDVMGNLHAYLEATFPRVYSTLDVEKVQKWGLLLTWKGSNDKLKPVVLMAHQDTVPVNPSTVDQWTYPPFDAHYDEEGWIWGRGVADCKNTLIGLFAALDKLIEDGFEPTRTIVLSSGFDEEVGGHRSAAHLASALESRYGKDGVALVLDEGFTGVDTAYGVPFARFGMAEKGAVSVQIEVLTAGGHSSVPLSAHTGIGVLAQCITALEAHPAKPQLQKGNPLLQQLQCAADHGEVEKAWRKRVRNPKQWKKLGGEMASQDPIMRAFLGTTQAVDLIKGGVKLNALPEYASASVNYRIDFQSSVNETLEHISSILEPVVARLNLSFSAYGSHDDVENNVVRLSMVGTSAIEPAPLTPTDGDAWDLMAGTTRHIWEGAVVAPSGMVANTDTKYSWPLTRHIYRFVPGSLELIKAFHTVDERIHIDAHLSGVRFFYKLLRNTEGWGAA